MSESHFNDVASTDQHTVKPWFAGKLDFAPPVADYASSGFSLAGGRVDYLGGRPVAAITYRLRLHAVNLFVWPAQGAPDSAARTATRQGYAIVRWTRGGMGFCAIADVAPGDLAVLADLVRPPL
jgi:anti-sigma factor RsiW